MTGTFTISLDFELHWGGSEKWPIENCKQYFLNTRKAIPRMLQLFEYYKVHATWATVGILLHESKKELLENMPVLKPSYHVANLSPYRYINSVGIGDDEDTDPFHYAPSLVKQIMNTPHQELGTHTYAHYYCNEAGQTLDQFREDLKAAQRVAKSHGTNFQSLVFPRNQFNDSYLKVCHEEGIKSVRSNPLDWFWRIDSTQDESNWKRLNRGLDAYFNIGKKNTYKLASLQVRDGYPVCIPASRLLRPYHPREFFLNNLKTQRIKNELSKAAKLNEVYHLWWHPHNFGNYPEQSLKALDEILNHYKHCHDSYNMQSHNMSELTSLLRYGN